MITLLKTFFIKDNSNYNDPNVRQTYGMLCGGLGIFLNLCLFLGKFIAGTLSRSIAITADAFNNLNGRYFCGIQLQTPIEIKLSDYETNCYSALYLLDNDSENLVQFDHPLLQSCVVGDTILVTGTPVQISDGIALGIAMRYVQPLHP